METITDSRTWGRNGSCMGSLYPCPADVVDSRPHLLTGAYESGSKASHFSPFGAPPDFQSRGRIGGAGGKVREGVIVTRRIVSSPRFCSFPKLPRFACLQLIVAASTLSSSVLAADTVDAQTPAAPVAPSALVGMQTDNGQGAAPAAPPSGANTVGGAGGPSVSLGTDGATAPAGAAPAATAPAADKAPEEPKEKKKHWLDKFAGSAIFNQTSANLNTFFPSLQADRNPTVDTFLLFLPRYALSKDFQVRARIGVSYEFTNGDTTYRNEPMLTDAGFQLFYRGIPAFANIKIQPNIGVAVPTSKASLARGMYFNPTLGLQASYANEHVLGGEFGAILIGSYSHPVYNAKAATQDPRPYAVQTMGGSSASDGQQISPGPMNASDQFAISAIVVQEWGKFEPGLWMQVRSEFLYSPKDVPGVRSLNDPNTIRNGTYFAAWLDYHLNEWLTPELGYYMSRRTLADNGKIGNPFFSEYQDMRVYLGANIQLDSLFKSVLGVRAESGIVRAQNKKTPMMAF